MARNVQGKTTETPGEATQAENSPDTFYMLWISLAILAVIAVVLLWHFGFLPGTEPLAPRQNG